MASLGAELVSGNVRLKGAIKHAYIIIIQHGMLVQGTSGSTIPPRLNRHNFNQVKT
jgi:hypothetical protein